MSSDLKWCPKGCVGGCKTRPCQRRTFSAWFRERRPPQAFLDRVETIVESFNQRDKALDD